MYHHSKGDIKRSKVVKIKGKQQQRLVNMKSCGCTLVRSSRRDGETSYNILEPILPFPFAVGSGFNLYKNLEKSAFFEGIFLRYKVIQEVLLIRCFEQHPILPDMQY